MSSVAKQPGEVLLFREELREGDRLFGRETEDWGTLQDFGGHTVAFDLKHAYLWDYKRAQPSKDWYEIDRFTGKGRWRVVRPSKAASTQFKKSDDGWNSNCPKCGCRTYVGFTKVEHESDSCVA